jgi:hypothetical protein
LAQRLKFLEINLIKHSSNLNIEIYKVTEKKFPTFITELFTIAKLWKQPRCPTTDEWIKKMWYFYTMEFY